MAKPKRKGIPLERVEKWIVKKNPVEVTKRFVRVRVKHPRLFHPRTFRVHDIGRLGHSKRVAGILRKTGKWSTQGYLVSRADLKRLDPRTLGILRQIKQRHGIAVRLKKVI